jgi:RecA-family ATPase
MEALMLKSKCEDLRKPETFLNHLDDLLKAERGNSSENIGLLIVKPANQWIKESSSRPQPNMLFSEFWSENEVCILFADTNTGKSILSVQIADSLSKGRKIPGFKNETSSQIVLLCDFELSDKQFETRYSINYKNHYQFSDNLKRIEINPNAELMQHKTFEEYLFESLQQTISETGAKILIVDNITYLRNATETAKDALPLMKSLKALKAKFNLSILALAHTPKRDFTKPITRNDLQGSKMLINFCDSAFTIGESQEDKSLRYLKQIKARNTEIIYDTENVALCQLSKPDNFLMFEFVNFGTERDHLKQQTDNDRENLREKAANLNQQGKSYREIGRELGISHMKVQRLIKGN